MIPGYGRGIRHRYYAQFSRTLGTLMENGITLLRALDLVTEIEIGRASGRGRGWISGVAGSFKKKKHFFRVAVWFSRTTLAVRRCPPPREGALDSYLFPFRYSAGFRRRCSPFHVFYWPASGQHCT